MYTIGDDALRHKYIPSLSHVIFYFKKRIAVRFPLTPRAILQMANDVILQQEKLEESLERIIARKVSVPTLMF